MQEEKRLKHEGVPVIHVVSQEHPKRKKVKKEHKGSSNLPKKDFHKLKYFFCNKEGHIKKDCKKRKK